MRPLDHKLKYQIDKLVRTAVTGSLGKTEVIRFSELCSLRKLWLKGCVSDSMHSKICIYPLMVGVTVSDAFVDFSWKWPTAAASQSRESRQQSKTRVTRRLRFLLLLSRYQTVNTCIQTSASCISRKDKCLFVFLQLSESESEDETENEAASEKKAAHSSGKKYIPPKIAPVHYGNVTGLLYKVLQYCFGVFC